MKTYPTNLEKGEKVRDGETVKTVRDVEVIGSWCRIHFMEGGFRDVHISQDVELARKEVIPSTPTV